MRKGSSIIGLKIISQAVKEHELANLGTVKDLVFDHEADEVLGLVVSEKDLFGLIDAQVVPWSQIVNIGTDAIIVQHNQSKIAAHDDPRVKDVMDRQTVLSGTKIYTTDGRDLGTFADLYIDENTGRIVGYEISGGFVSDTMSGKRFIAAPQEINIAKDVAIVPPAVAEELEAQKQQEPGGLQGAAAAVGDKVGAAYDSARSNASDAYANLAGATVAKQKEFVIGKVASRAVVIPDNSIPVATTAPTDATPSYPTPIPLGAVPATSADGPNLSIPTASESFGAGASESASVATSVGSGAGTSLVRQGETITADHAERAEAAGVLWQLVTAAGGGAAHEAVAGGATTAGGLGATVQQKAEAAALGKPAGREVLAPDGAVIVATGMTITPEILERARTYNKEREVIAAAGVGAAAQGVEAVKESAGNLWETLKHKAAELSGAAQDKRADMDAQMEETRIKGALGRPTDRVILDKNDNVILNAGELITHAAVAQARTAGVLDILLDSIYIADPVITPEMLRARDHGQAAIPSAADGQVASAAPSASEEPALALPPASSSSVS